jgi:hypothetical protein
MPGRVPARIGAIVMKSAEGNEFACIAKTHKFADGPASRERGVLSYYACRTMAKAPTLAKWLEAITESAAADVAAGRLPRTHIPQLQIIGPASARAPGWVGK